MQRTIPLRPYDGRPYFIAVRGEPNLQSPEDFAATLYYKDSDEERQVDVARIDTDHGHVHLDKLFLENEGKKPMDVDLWGAVEHLSEHHPEYARRYRNKSR